MTQISNFIVEKYTSLKAGLSGTAVDFLFCILNRCEIKNMLVNIKNGFVPVGPKADRLKCYQPLKEERNHIVVSVNDFESNNALFEKQLVEAGRKKTTSQNFDKLSG